MHFLPSFSMLIASVSTLTVTTQRFFNLLIDSPPGESVIDAKHVKPPCAILIAKQHLLMYAATEYNILGLSQSSDLFEMLDEDRPTNANWPQPTFQRKTKIVCTIGPTSWTKEMIWKVCLQCNLLVLDVCQIVLL